MRLDPHNPLDDSFLADVQNSLDHFFISQRELLAPTGDRLDIVWDQARHYAEGGKRIRPAFCYWGYVAVAGTQSDPPVAVMDIAASLDLLHLSALVHDDLIDASDTRRGAPAAHRYFQAFHGEQGWPGDSTRFGQSAAILLGDLLFAWSIAMAEQSGISGKRKNRARHYLDAMRVEVLAGQFLELIHQDRPSPVEDLFRDAGLVMDLKSAKYTVTRPVQIGAALAMAGDDVQHHLGLFGTHVGNAFQMRDDLLGLFGDPEVTGKPAGDDLREGKKTVVISYALASAAPSQVDTLLAMLGNPCLSEADIDHARQILTDCGAVATTERAIEAEAASGMKYLHRLNLSDDGTYALIGLAHAAVERTA